MKLIVPRPWMQNVLILAGIYNLVWGSFAIFEPGYFFRNLNLKLPDYPIMWQGIGLIECLFGVGYLIASRKPFKHWTIIFLGFVIKLAASLGYAYHLYIGTLPQSLWMLVLANDLIWLLPFGAILYATFQHNQCTRELGAYDVHPRRLKSLEKIITNEGRSLEELTDNKPTLLIFLRHFGCTFCREALQEIAANRPSIEKEGTQIVLVHMVGEDVAENITSHYALNDLPRISDPQKKIYKAFGLNKGNLFQLLGINVVIRGFEAGVCKGHMIGKFAGDGFQMPGVFLIHKGTVLQTFKHTTAADRPDYIELSKVRTSE